ncbi:hypothetical protein [Gemmiger formicilis]|uniref:hypothetical protein n=1 Tax=Gemmiger formicilis TaxID=745368 RepID=UPI003993A80F
MNQSFFTLSLGIGAIEIFGSYMDRRFTLPGEGRAHLRAGHLCGGLRRAYHLPGLLLLRHLSRTQDPSLIFITLPSVLYEHGRRPPAGHTVLSCS